MGAAMFDAAVRFSRDGTMVVYGRIFERKPDGRWFYVWVCGRQRNVGAVYVQDDFGELVLVHAN